MGKSITFFSLLWAIFTLCVKASLGKLFHTEARQSQQWTISNLTQKKFQISENFHHESLSRLSFCFAQLFTPPLYAIAAVVGSVNFTIASLRHYGTAVCWARRAGTRSRMNLQKNIFRCLQVGLNASNTAAHYTRAGSKKQKNDSRKIWKKMCSTLQQRY